MTSKPVFGRIMKEMLKGMLFNERINPDGEDGQDFYRTVQRLQVSCDRRGTVCL
jgi:hypothetical protein